jgi:myxalamid-type polyketide synthase MxaE and MxaD
MGLELKNSLQASLGVSLSATMVFNYPTVALLSQHLAEKIAPKQDDTELMQVSEFAPAALPRTPEANEQLHEILAEIEHLSDHEVRRRMSG